MNLRQIATDLQRRYEKTFVFIEFPDGDSSMFFIERIANDDDRVARITCRSPDYGVLSINHGSAHRLKFRFPKSRVFQHGKIAMQFKRVPRKQYRRGICSDNCLVSPTFWRLWANMGNQIEHPTLSSAFEGVTYGYEEALLLLKEQGYSSVALNNNFSISLSPFSTGTPGFLLFWWDTCVAKVGEDGKLLTVFHNALAPEISKILTPKE